jgi:hypothetical protein
MIYQKLRLKLEGMTACDYLAHFHDPEPAVLGSGLREVVVRATPLDDVVEALLTWNETPSDECAAAHLAGFATPAEVVDVQCRVVRSLDECDEYRAAA